MAPGKRGHRPNKQGKGTVTEPPRSVSSDGETPKFCLSHLQAGYRVADLTTNGQAAFAVALEKRSAMTWRQIATAPRHGLGTEFIAKSSIKGGIPIAFEDRERFMALRYDGLLPMCGVRVGAVLHLLWLEPHFNALYDH